MKILSRILIYTLSFFSIHSIGQTVTSSNATNEGGALQLINPLKTANNIANNWTLYNMTEPYGNSLQFWNYGNNGFYGTRLTILDDGRVGIGTSNPLAQLDVNGNINLAGATGRRIFMGGAGGSTFGLAYDSTYPNYGIFYTEAEPDFVSISPNGNSTNGVINVFGNGNVGIGTINPTSKLTVAGNINSREVKVSVDAGADFVFEKDYALPSLQEVEKFVNENKHLPEIASAKEMQKEGINLSEMNIKLLQKIEELTLYVIQQQKLITQQAKELESHKVMLAKIDQMEKTLAKMNTANEK